MTAVASGANGTSTITAWQAAAVSPLLEALRRGQRVQYALGRRNGKSRLHGELMELILEKNNGPEGSTSNSDV